MAEETIGYVEKNVTGTLLYKAICNEFREVTYNIKEAHKEECDELGYIRFLDKDSNQRNLFYCITEDRRDLFNDKHADLSLGYGEGSFEVMISIVKHFGGYVLKNDCGEDTLMLIPECKDISIKKYMELQDEIIDCLDNNLSYKNKIMIANQIIKHKDEIILKILT